VRTCRRSDWTEGNAEDGPGSAEYCPKTRNVAGRRRRRCTGAVAADLRLLQGHLLLRQLLLDLLLVLDQRLVLVHQLFEPAPARPCNCCARLDLLLLGFFLLFDRQRCNIAAQRQAQTPAALRVATRFSLVKCIKKLLRTGYVLT